MVSVLRFGSVSGVLWIPHRGTGAVEAFVGETAKSSFVLVGITLVWLSVALWATLAPSDTGPESSAASLGVTVR